MANTFTPEIGNLDDQNPLAIARFLRAFAECSRELQETALEMSAIIVDKESSEDERELACEALMEALFPGAAAEVLQSYRRHLKSPDAMRAGADLQGEAQVFTGRLKALMREKNVSQEALAKSAGIDPSAVSNILDGRCRPQRRTIARFAESLGVSPTDLWPVESQPF